MLPAPIASGHTHTPHSNFMYNHHFSGVYLMFIVFDSITSQVAIRNRKILYYFDDCFFFFCGASQIKKASSAYSPHRLMRRQTTTCHANLAFNLHCLAFIRRFNNWRALVRLNLNANHCDIHHKCSISESSTFKSSDKHEKPMIPINSSIYTIYSLCCCWCCYCCWFDNDRILNPKPVDFITRENMQIKS